MALHCVYHFTLEALARRVWCVGGPEMPVEEVEHELCLEAGVLQFFLSHIPDLSYDTIRNAGLAYLILTGTREARQIGFLADGYAFEVMRLDKLEYERLARERLSLFLHVAALRHKRSP